MMWMNSYEISEALVRFENHPVLSKAARLLDMLREETDNHSDGWHSWPRPARAAERLMVLLKSGRGTEQDLKLAVRPIKAFPDPLRQQVRPGCTRHTRHPGEQTGTGQD